MSKEFERHYFFPRGNKFVLHTLSDPENYKYMWTMRSGPGGSTSSMPGPNTGQYLSCVWTSSLCKYINQRTGIIKTWANNRTFGVIMLRGMLNERQLAIE